MLLANMINISERKQLVFFSVEIIKNSINLILTYMISSKKSKYKNIQQSGQSFFQSGNKLLWSIYIYMYINLNINIKENIEN